MQHILHFASSRGGANHGWLKAKHSFSFADYYNPNRMGFGMLRVLNDDIIAPAKGFGRHPHDNMEIITIPFRGKLQHQDSMGFSEVITPGQVQIMSAGTGIFHSEFNASEDEEINLFQIWIHTDAKGHNPRYQTINFSMQEKPNKWVQLVSPNSDDEGGWIHQQAWIQRAVLDKDSKLDYTLHSQKHGVYAIIISGNASILEAELHSRDAIGLWDINEITINAIEKTDVLLIEVPVIA